MTATHIQRGDNLDYINPTDETIAPGTVIVLGDRCGVAAAAIPPGKTGALAMTGVYELAKSTSEEIKAGTEVYYDAATDTATTVGAAVEGDDATSVNAIIGYAVADAAETSAAVLVKFMS